MRVVAKMESATGAREFRYLNWIATEGKDLNADGPVGVANYAVWRSRAGANE